MNFIKNGKTTIVDGYKLFYLDQGEGVPILLLHGYPQNHLTWRKQIPTLAQDYRIIAPDFFGWGKSDKPLDIDYNYNAELDRLGRWINQLGLRQFHLFAHDYGGFLALSYAMQNPEKFLSLAILNSRSQGTFYWHWKWLFHLFGYVKKWFPLAKYLPVKTAHAIGLRREVNIGCFDWELLENYIAHFADSRWLFTFFEYYQVKIRKSIRDGLSEIKMPTAVIWGEKDKYLSPKIARQLAEEIPDARLTWIKNAGHYIMEEKPEEVLDALRQLLARSKKRELP